MKNTISLLLLFLVFYSCTQNTSSKSQLTTNSVYNGIEYINNGFDDFDIVAIGEHHGIVEVTDFYIQLVKNEDFREKTDVIVFELGNSLYQDVLDEYLLGVNNDTIQIKKLWREHTSSFLQTGDWTGVKRFFEAVRNVNIESANKIRILAAEPPINWSEIKCVEEYFSFIEQRDKFYNEVVKKEVLDKNKKALLIMGAAHFNKSKAHRMDSNPISSLLKLSKKVLLITTMTMDDFPYDQLPPLNQFEVIETNHSMLSELKIGPPFIKKLPLKVQTDALLYLGDKKDLKYEEYTPFNDKQYEAELDRRKKLPNCK